MLTRRNNLIYSTVLSDHYVKLICVSHYTVINHVFPLYPKAVHNKQFNFQIQNVPLHLFWFFTSGYGSVCKNVVYLYQPCILNLCYFFIVIKNYIILHLTLFLFVSYAIHDCQSFIFSRAAPVDVKDEVQQHARTGIEQPVYPYLLIENILSLGQSSRLSTKGMVISVGSLIFFNILPSDTATSSDFLDITFLYMFFIDINCKHCILAELFITKNDSINMLLLSSLFKIPCLNALLLWCIYPFVSY